MSLARMAPENGSSSFFLRTLATLNVELYFLIFFFSNLALSMAGFCEPLLLSVTHRQMSKEAGGIDM
jgi:hypothetical protein